MHSLSRWFLGSPTLSCAREEERLPWFVVQLDCSDHATNNSKRNFFHFMKYQKMELYDCIEYDPRHITQSDTHEPTFSLAIEEDE